MTVHEHGSACVDSRYQSNHAKKLKNEQGIFKTTLSKNLVNFPLLFLGKVFGRLKFQSKLLSFFGWLP
jgi:hypothetical protein